MKKLRSFLRQLRWQNVCMLTLAGIISAVGVVVYVSSALTETRLRIRTAIKIAVNRPLSVSMVVTPVVFSPLINAQLIGALPLYFGSREA